MRDVSLLPDAHPLRFRTRVLWANLLCWHGWQIISGQLKQWLWPRFWCCCCRFCCCCCCCCLGASPVAPLAQVVVVFFWHWPKELAVHIGQLTHTLHTFTHTYTHIVNTAHLMLLLLLLRRDTFFFVLIYCFCLLYNRDGRILWSSYCCCCYCNTAPLCH